MDENIARELKGALDMFREANEKADAERQKYGEATAETKALIETLGERMDKLEAEKDRPAGEAKAKAEVEEKARAFREYVSKGRAHMPAELRALLVEDATGEILVPEDLDRELQRAIPKFTPMRDLVTVRPTTSDRVRRRSLTELTVAWGALETGEQTLTRSDMTPSEAFLYVEDLYGLTKIGENELADSDHALEPIVSDSFARAIAQAIDTAIIAGLGHASNQPEGIATASGITNVDAAGPGAVTADDLIDLAYGPAAQYRQGAGVAYVVASTTEKAMRKLKDANDQYMWQQSLQAGVPSVFNGYPVVLQEDVPAVPAAGTAGVVAYFGNFKEGYTLLERSGTSIQRLNELYAEAGLVGFIVHRRVGGGVTRAASLAKLTVPAA